MWFFIFYRARQDGPVLLVSLAGEFGEAGLGWRGQLVEEVGSSPSKHSRILTQMVDCRAGSTRGTTKRLGPAGSERD